MNRRDFLGALAGGVVGLAAAGGTATLFGCGGGGGTKDPPLHTSVYTLLHAQWFAAGSFDELPQLDHLRAAPTI
jgi:hypothetical protein